MATITASKSINAPVERVFAVFADLRSAPQRIKAIRKIEVLTDGPIGKGTRFRETRTMFNRDAIETMEIIDFQPNRSYAVGCVSCGVDIKTTFHFAAEGAGTRVDMNTEVRPVTLFAKVLSPLSRLMMGPMMRKCIEQDMEDLRKTVEN